MQSDLPPPQNNLDAEVLKQFRIIFKSVRKHFQAVESAVGISGAQLWALFAIAESPGMRITELAKAMALHQSTTSNLVEKLFELGLVRREKSATDARAVGLYLTELGAERLPSAPAPFKGLLPDALEKLPYGTLRDLNVCLDALLNIMQRLERDAGDTTPLSDS